MRAKVVPAARAGRVLALALLLVAPFVSAAPSTRAAASGPGPLACVGPDLVVLLDASSSIRGLGGETDLNGVADDVVASATALLEAAANTGVRAAVLSYNSNAVVHSDLAEVTTASLAPGGVHALALGDPGGPDETIPADATGYAAQVRDGGGSNWEAAFDLAAEVVGANGGYRAAIIHITDGQPTWHVGDDGVATDIGSAADHLEAATSAAQRLREAGASLDAFGVGPAGDDPAALLATAGGGVYHQADSDGRFDRDLDDVLLVSDPALLAPHLRGFAPAECGAGLTVRVLTAATEAGPFVPSEDVAVTVRPESPGGYAWVAPDDDEADSKRLATAGGEARVLWSVAGGGVWEPSVSVAVDVPEGFVPLDGSCGTSLLESGSVRWEDGTFAVDVDAASDVLCRLRVVEAVDATSPDSIEREAAEPLGAVDVEPLLVLEKSASASSVPPGTTVTFELVVTNGGTDPLGEVVVLDPGCGPLSPPSKAQGDDGDDHLDAGERWTYACRATIDEATTNVGRASAWAVDAGGDRLEGGSVEARASASVTVTASVAGVTQVPDSGRDARLPVTGTELLGFVAGGAGLLGLGMLLVAGRRDRP